jgi:hypothetical protein
MDYNPEKIRSLDHPGLMRELREFVVDTNSRFANLSLAGVVSFETISKNLSSYPSTLTYTNDYLSNITYIVPSGVIVKSLYYTPAGQLTSIVLSGSGLPTGTQTTKTITYDTSGKLTGIIYS